MLLDPQSWACLKVRASGLIVVAGAAECQLYTAPGCDPMGLIFV